MKINRLGFSAVEAVVVAVIFGILLVVGIPIMTSALAEYRLNNAAQVLGAATQRARYLASSGNRQYVLRITTADPNLVEVFLDANWDMDYTSVDSTEATSAGIVGYVSLRITPDTTVSDVDFGTYSSGSGRILVFYMDGTILNPTTPPGPDPWNSAYRTPKLQLHTTYWGSSGDRWVGISKFGEVTPH
jgi:type II secretory pathway pseudopilin PulG